MAEDNKKKNDGASAPPAETGTPAEGVQTPPADAGKSDEPIIQEEGQNININIPKSDDGEEKISVGAFEKLRGIFSPPKEEESKIPNDIKQIIADQQKKIADQEAKMNELSEYLLKTHQQIGDNNENILEGNLEVNPNLNIPTDNQVPPTTPAGTVSEDPLVNQQLGGQQPIQQNMPLDPRNPNQFQPSGINTIPDGNTLQSPPPTAPPQYQQQTQVPPQQIVPPQQEQNFQQAPQQQQQQVVNPYQPVNERTPQAPPAPQEGQPPVQEIPSDFAIMDALGRDKVTGEKIIDYKSTATVGLARNTKW